MKVLVVFVVILVLVSASILPQMPNKKRYQYTQIIIDNIDENDNSLVAKYSLSEAAVMALEHCSNGICDVECKLIGWRHGRCVSANTCECYN